MLALEDVVQPLCIKDTIGVLEELLGRGRIETVDNVLGQRSEFPRELVAHELLAALLQALQLW